MKQEKERIFDALSRRFVHYQELFSIPIIENGEAMKNVAEYGLTAALSFSKIEASTQGDLLLRKGVCERLAFAQKKLGEMDPNLNFLLVYAYRSMEIQNIKFQNLMKDLGLSGRTDPQSLELAHRFIAVPEVAGHPTGGAIDLMLADREGRPLDFGTGMHALEENSYAYSPFISDEATLNRKKLRLAMTSAGFAPYDGEWWHFSYGDREWAAYYQEPQAFYKQLSEQDI